MVSENIKFLRKKNGWTQEQFSEKIGIKRSLLGAYEEGRADPRLNNLLNMAKVFQLKVDALISKDLTQLDDQQIQMEVDDPKLKILSITVDKDNNENIELVRQKAAAGYLNGYADPEFIEELPRFNLPVLSPHNTYRAFEITGDSMLPLQSGTIIIGQYLEGLSQIKNSKTYVLITSDEGVVYKRVFNYLEDRKALYLVSDNQNYSPYEVKASDVLEVWEAKAYISMQFPEQQEGKQMTLEKLAEIVLDLQKEVIKLKE